MWCCGVYKGLGKCGQDAQIDGVSYGSATEWRTYLQACQRPAGDCVGQLAHPSVADVVVIESEPLEGTQRPTGYCAGKLRHPSIANLLLLKRFSTWRAPSDPLAIL